MGLSRGKAHIAGFTGIDNTEIAYVCDVDNNRLASFQSLYSFGRLVALYSAGTVFDFSNFIPDFLMSSEYQV